MRDDYGRSELNSSTGHPIAGEVDDRGLLALAAGLGAAILGGVIWAAIVLLANLEIGWAALAVGLLVGLAITRVTTQRSRGLGLAAAGLAAVGLLVGKVAITLGSAATISNEIINEPEILEGTVAWQMYEAEELAAETQEAVFTTLEAGDTLSDALWAEMRVAAEAKLAGMTDQEKEAVATQLATGYVGSIGIIDAIRVQLSAWDLLWFGLAIATAFRMVAGRRETAAQV